MSHRTLTRLALGALMAGLIAAPTASALPVDLTGPAAVHDTAPVDDARAEAAASGGGVEKSATVIRDARGEAAGGGGGGVEKSATVIRDARGEAAAGGGGTGAGPSGRELPGPPTWPVNPAPLSPSDAPLVDDGGDGGGIDLPVALLLIAGTLALGGGMAAAALKSRARTHAAH